MAKKKKPATRKKSKSTKPGAGSTMYPKSRRYGLFESGNPDTDAGPKRVYDAEGKTPFKGSLTPRRAAGTIGNLVGGAANELKTIGLRHDPNIKRIIRPAVKLGRRLAPAKKKNR